MNTRPLDNSTGEHALRGDPGMCRMNDKITLEKYNELAPPDNGTAV